jgi:hypothetical protein
MKRRLIRTFLHLLTFLTGAGLAYGAIGEWMRRAALGRIEHYANNSKEYVNGKLRNLPQEPDQTS